MPRIPESIPKRLRRELARLALYGAAFALLLVAVARLAGYDLALLPRGAATRGAAPVDLGPRPAVAPLADDFDAGAEVRNVILLLADGLGPAHVVAARSELVGLNGRLGFERMPVGGWLTTHEAGSLVTDSAAGATALATGVKTDRGMLGVGPDARPLRTVMEAARDAGLATGVVTDTFLWDATPAAFLTHVPTRGNRREIAAQMARSGADLLIGELAGGVPAESGDGRTIVGGFEEEGYAVARSWAELATIAPGRRIAALLDPGTIPDPERPPDLVELAELALARLGDGFFLLVETEETDTGSHRRDLGQVAAGVRAIDQAASVALDFARRDRRTLVLLTADHETGGLVLESGRQGGRLGLRWATGNHSGGPVPLYAYGPGARRFAAVRDNTEIAGILADLLGLEMALTPPGPPLPPTHHTPPGEGGGPVSTPGTSQ